MGLALVVVVVGAGLWVLFVVATYFLGKDAGRLFAAHGFRLRTIYQNESGGVMRWAYDKGFRKGMKWGRDRVEENRERFFNE